MYAPRTSPYDTLWLLWLTRLQDHFCLTGRATGLGTATTLLEPAFTTLPVVRTEWQVRVAIGLCHWANDLSLCGDARTLQS